MNAIESVINKIEARIIYYDNMLNEPHLATDEEMQLKVCKWEAEDILIIVKKAQKEYSTPEHDWDELDEDYLPNK